VAITQYKQQYRIESSRLSGRDYGANGWYYVTIKTWNAKRYFGEINNSKMILSPVGKIATNVWKIIPHKHCYVELDEMIVMPDHLHGILHIDHELHNKGDAINRVSTSPEIIFNKSNKGGITGNNNPMLTKNLSRVIRWYKGRVKYETTKMNLDFKWHSRFHDRILRLENDELNIKRNYIRNNPKKWNPDM